MTERVVVTQGSTTTSSPTATIKDWNNPLNKIEVFYAGKMVERKNGAVVRDLTTKETETGNVYVVAPGAGKREGGDEGHGADSARRDGEDGAAGRTRTVPTPRMGAHPDLTGNWSWNDWIGNYMTGGGRRCGPTQQTGLQPAGSIRLKTSSSTRRRGSATWVVRSTSREHWDKVQELDMWTNKYDPVMTCQPLGVPREGPPRRIYQTDEGRDVPLLRAAMPEADTASIA